MQGGTQALSSGEGGGDAGGSADSAVTYILAVFLVIVSLRATHTQRPDACALRVLAATLITSRPSVSVACHVHVQVGLLLAGAMWKLYQSHMRLHALETTAMKASVRNETTREPPPAPSHLAVRRMPSGRAPTPAPLGGAELDPEDQPITIGEGGGSPKADRQVGTWHRSMVGSLGT